MSGTQSILTKNKCTLALEYESKLEHNANNKYAFEKFLIGQNISTDLLQHDLRLYRIFNTDNCELANFIQNKIENYCNFKTENLHKCFKKYRKHNKKECSDTEIVIECCSLSDLGATEW